MRLTIPSRFLGLWLLLGGVAAAVCSLTWPAAHLGDEYLPVSIDSFYHARRILDTAAEPAAFYEFDRKIHAPEGSLLTWPWGYDYVMAMLVRAAGALGASASPIGVLIWIPVAAVFLSVGMMMLIARRLALSNWAMIIAVLCIALSPLTQLLHGVGAIDHHFAEYIFVLATVGYGLTWFLRPQSTGAAVATGLILGIAPAVHNGLFILQIPVLAGMMLLWLQNIRFPRQSTTWFAVTLVVATLAILVPSLPFRSGRFEFYTLSWFHLYVATASAIVAYALSVLTKSKRSLLLLTGAAIVLVLPLAQQILVARAFLAGTITRLDAIVEMRPPLRMALAPGGIREVSLLYSALIWLVPLTALYCAIQLWQERASGRVFFWLCCLGGLTLLVTQLRLHYFGSFALYLPLLILAERAATRWPTQRKAVFLTASLAFLVAYWLPARYQLTATTAPAGDSNFRALRPALSELQKACASKPGIVLADNDAGHYIRYYTECSVIANNFLLTKQHEQKIHEIDYLTSLSAKDFPEKAPHVRYILLRPVIIMRTEDQGMEYMSFSPKSAQLISDLLLRPVSEAPPAFKLIGQVNIRSAKEESTVPYLRLFEVQQEGS